MPVQAYIVRQFSTEALMVAMMPVLYAGAQFFAAPLLGKLSDRYGRRPVLLISILGSALGYYLFGIGGALWVLFLSRLIDGFTGGNISIASAYVADVTPPKDRAKNFGLLGAAFGLGFILGPVLGGVLSQISLDAPAYAAGTLSLVSAVTGFFILPESLPKEKRETRPFRLADVNPFTTVVELLRRPTVGALLITQSLFFFVFNGNNSVLPVFLIDKFSVQPWQIAMLFAIGGFTMALVQGALVAPLVKRFNEKTLAANSLLFQALAAVGIISVPALWMLYPTIVLNNLGTGLIWPTLGAILANSVSTDEQGKVSGVSTALGSCVKVYAGASAEVSNIQGSAAGNYGGGMDLECETIEGDEAKFEAGRDLRCYIRDLISARVIVNDQGGYWEGMIGDGKLTVRLKAGGDVTLVKDQKVAAIPPDFVLGQIERLAG